MAQYDLGASYLYQGARDLGRGIEGGVSNYVTGKRDRKKEEERRSRQLYLDKRYEDETTYRRGRDETADERQNRLDAWSMEKYASEQSRQRRLDEMNQSIMEENQAVAEQNRQQAMMDKAYNRDFGELKSTYDIYKKALDDGDVATVAWTTDAITKNPLGQRFGMGTDWGAAMEQLAKEKKLRDMGEEARRRKTQDEAHKSLVQYRLAGVIRDYNANPEIQHLRERERLLRSGMKLVAGQYEGAEPQMVPMTEDEKKEATVELDLINSRKSSIRNQYGITPQQATDDIDSQEPREAKTKGHPFFSPRNIKGSDAREGILDKSSGISELASDVADSAISYRKGKPGEFKDNLSGVLEHKRPERKKMWYDPDVSDVISNIKDDITSRGVPAGYDVKSETRSALLKRPVIDTPLGDIQLPKNITVRKEIGSSWARVPAKKEDIRKAIEAELKKNPGRINLADMSGSTSKNDDAYYGSYKLMSDRELWDILSNYKDGDLTMAIKKYLGTGK